MLVRSRAVSALLLFLLILVLPASAAAAPVIVNTTADEPDAVPGGFCETAGGKCSLRAAIELTNLTLAERERVEFSGTVFKGDLASTIKPSTALPTITAPLEIDGGACTTEAGVSGPCAGIEGPSGQSALTVEADNTSVLGLSIAGATIGIDVINASTKFTARGNWIGLKLNGVNGGNSSTGIFIDPDSNEATIGGSEAAQRNIISFNSLGLDIEGADDAVIRGNWFGLQAQEGGKFAGPAGKNIEITDSTAGLGFKAEGNEIGAVLSEGAAKSSECDGGCNVLSGSTGFSIDLQGNGAGQNEAPASGPTIIHGNFIGLNAAGTGVLGNAIYGVLAGEADHVQIGGASPSETNYIAGGEYGIYTEKGEDFEAHGNQIGYDASGAEATPPSVKGMFVDEEGVLEPADIEGNAIRMLGGVGIDELFEGARIIGNSLEGGNIGILTRAEPGGGLIAGNTVDAPSEYGILIENRNTEARGNTVTNSQGVGIAVKNPPGVAMTGVLIGGNTAEKENVIEGSNGPAIEIVEEALEPGSETEIARNRGASNGGLFIDLVAGANEGISPPAISTALQSSAGGSAEPGATIRVFRKASAEPGELQSFLAETVADGSGNWKVNYSSVPAGTLVTATQTNENGATSELATPVAASAEGGGGGGGEGGGGGTGGGGSTGGGNNGKGKDTTPPDTKIVKGPPKKTHKTKVKFKFTSNEAGSTFQCKLDRKPFKTCRSPKTYKKLKPGKHVFKVRAIDKAGNVDPTPAKRKFTVLR